MLFSRLLACVRLIGFFFLLVGGLFTAGVVFRFLHWKYRRRIIRGWSRLVVATVGIRIVVDAPPPHKDMAGLMVSNHSSWMDIFVTNSMQAVRFIAKSDVRDWPVLGTLVTLAGTLYVERGNRQRIGFTNDEISAAVASGDLVGLYPEGTTTDGSYLLPFKSNLFQPAIVHAMRVYPVAVRYRHKGQPTRLACYEGDMTFGQSVFTLLGAWGVEAHISFGTPIDGGQFDHRVDLAMATQAAVEELSGLRCREPSQEQLERQSGRRS